MKTRLVFCAREQKDTDQTARIDTNGEYVIECGCGSFFKLPGGLPAAELEALVVAHKTENEGQVSVEAVEARDAQLLSQLDGQ